MLWKCIMQKPKNHLTAVLSLKWLGQVLSEVWPTRICHGWVGHLVQGWECTFITPRLTPKCAKVNGQIFKYILQKMCTNTYLYGPWVRRNSIIQHQYHHHGHPILNIIIISFPASSSAAWWAAAWWATTWWAAYWARSRKLWSERRRPPLASHRLSHLVTVTGGGGGWERSNLPRLLCYHLAHCTLSTKIVCEKLHV